MLRYPEVRIRQSQGPEPGEELAHDLEHRVPVRFEPADVRRDVDPSILRPTGAPQALAGDPARLTVRHPHTSFAPAKATLQLSQDG